MPYSQLRGKELDMAEGLSFLRAFQVVQWVKNPPAIQELREMQVSSLGQGRSPGGRHGNSLQYFCLENPMDRGAWWATVHRAAKSWTQLNEHKESTCDEFQGRI